MLSADEAEAMEMLLAVVDHIREDWGLMMNEAELTQAVHVIQGFIIQHMLQRLAPGQWGRWYAEKKR
jgi:hypothetical protein